MVKHSRAFFSKITDEKSQRRVHKLKGVDKVEFANGEGDVLFHVVGYAVDFFVLYSAKSLHNKMRVVATEVMKDDWDLPRKLVADYSHCVQLLDNFR